MSNDASIKNIAIFIMFFILMILFYLNAEEQGWLYFLQDQQKFSDLIKNFGLIGPIAIIALIAIAIIITPIPSAPIAVTSGALFGHTFGTIYVVMGAVLGALIAFTISRKLGYDYVTKKLHHRMPERIIGSQNTLMAIVFVTRLVPFISFDIISYAAGLTKLTFARFFIATLMGIIPISFLLAHIGSEAKNGEMESIIIALLLLGLFTMAPILANKWMGKSNDGNE